MILSFSLMCFTTPMKSSLSQRQLTQLTWQKWQSTKYSMSGFPTGERYGSKAIFFKGTMQKFSGSREHELKTFLETRGFINGEQGIKSKKIKGSMEHIPPPLGGTQFWKFSYKYQRSRLWLANSHLETEFVMTWYLTRDIWANKNFVWCFNFILRNLYEGKIIFLIPMACPFS